MRRPSFQNAAICVAGATIAMLATHNSTGAVTYRVTDLGTLDTEPTGSHVSEAFAVNDLGQVVSWSSYTGGIGHHAFRWDNVNGMIDLGTLGGQDSEAHDINESGQIVGTANNHSDHQRAFIWLPEAIPGIPGQEPYELGTFSSRPFAVSEGWGINDATPFQVVGQSETDDPCVGPYIHLGFVWDSEGGMEPLASEGDGPGGEPNESSAAFAINTPPGGLPTVIAGEGSRCGVSANFCGYPGIDAVRWEWDEVNQIFLPRALLQPKGFGEGIGHALDVNDAGQMVGWGRIQPDDCTDHALIWTQAGLSVDVLETDPADEQAYALAINDSASPQIVGRNEDRALAAIWSFAVGDWQYEELDDFISAGCGWALRWARDINDMDAAWIVGWGYHDGKKRAFLLTPLGDCPADINGDGVVNVNDFLDLIAQWGECETGVICIADINGDCVVNIVDFLDMQAAWGPCPESDGQSLQPPEDGSGVTLSEAITLLGFADVEAYQAWTVEATEAEILASAELLATLILGE